MLRAFQCRTSAQIAQATLQAALQGAHCAQGKCVGIIGKSVSTFSSRLRAQDLAPLLAGPAARG